MAEDAFVTDFEHIMADDITENVRFIMYDSASGKTASAGEVSKYMMRNVHVDTTLTEEGSAAEAKAVGEALATKADTKGTYEDLIVGGAEQLMADGYETDKEPYLFRPTGGSADVGNREYLDKIVGGTVAWNQQVSIASIPATQTVNGVTFTNNADGTVTVSGTATEFTYPKIGPEKTWQAHKYAVFGCPAGGSKTTYALAMRGAGSDTWDLGNGAIWNAAGKWKAICAYVQSGVTVNNLVFKPQIFDLTLLFGSTIADYIYNLEQSSTGAGVAWFKKLFPKPYYEYNAGELMSVNTSAHNTVGFNQWDEEWEQGRYDGYGNKVTATNCIRAKNFIPCLPNTTYYFKNGFHGGGRVNYYDVEKQFIQSVTDFNATKTTPSNAYYMLFSTATEYGGTYRNDICINLSWDGERNGEYEPYQKHTYPLDSSLTLRGVPKLVDGKLAFDGDVYPPSGDVQRRYGLRAYQSGDESLADAITDGTNTVYKLATPTTETADGYEQYQICDSSGTEEFVTDSIVPVGHETRYPHDLKKKIETAPDSPSTDGTYLMKRSGGKNSYMALPSTPSANGAYVLTVTVSGGTASYSWTAKE